MGRTVFDLTYPRPTLAWSLESGSTKPYKFLGFGAMEVTKPYEFIGFGAMYVTKPYKFIGFGAMYVTKPYKFKSGPRRFHLQQPLGPSKTVSLHR